MLTSFPPLLSEVREERRGGQLETVLALLGLLETFPFLLPPVARPASPLLLYVNSPFPVYTALLVCLL